MEDAHTTIPEYKDTGASFFAVFDGHGGMYYEYRHNVYIYNMLNKDTRSQCGKIQWQPFA